MRGCFSPKETAPNRFVGAANQEKMNSPAGFKQFEGRISWPNPLFL